MVSLTHCFHTLFSEKMLIFSRCIDGFMPNSIKKSVTVSNWHPCRITRVQTDPIFLKKIRAVAPSILEKSLVGQLPPLPPPLY